MRDVPDGMALKLRAGITVLGAGFDDAGMGDLADASGIPRATLYYYFSGKADVLALMLATGVKEMGARVVAAAGSKNDGAKPRLRAVVEDLLIYFEENPTMSQLLLSNLGKAAKLPDIATDITAAAIRPIEEILSAGIATGELRDLDTGVAAAALFGAVSVTGIKSAVLLGGIDVAASTASIVDLFWSGLAR